MTDAHQAPDEPGKRLDIGNRARRIVLLHGAAELIGNARIADALDIKPRSLRAKFEASRGVAIADLHAVAVALDLHAARATAQAMAIRQTLATPAPNQPTNPV